MVKLARDIAGEISGEYDIRRAWDGVDPSSGENCLLTDFSWWDGSSWSYPNWKNFKSW